MCDIILYFYVRNAFINGAGRRVRLNDKVGRLGFSTCGVAMIFPQNGKWTRSDQTHTSDGIVCLTANDVTG